jgi:molybdopterin/thiamine biosynthesis adenylyltransferase
VAKNIILAGVKSAVFLDHRLASAQDVCSQFFISRDDIGKNVSWINITNINGLPLFYT